MPFEDDEVRVTSTPAATSNNDLDIDDCAVDFGDQDAQHADNTEDLYDCPEERCVPADQLVVTPSGMLYVGEVFAAAGLAATCASRATEVVYPLFNRDGVVETTTVFTHNGRSPVIRLTTRTGYVVKATANHSHLVMNTDGWWIWKKTKELKEGDYLITRRDYAAPMGTASSLSPDLLYFLGVVIADGSLTEKRIGATNNDPSVIEAIKIYGAELLRVSPKIYEKSASPGSFDFHFNSKEEVTALYEKLGWHAGVAKDKHLGLFIRSLDAEGVRAVLQGYFDCECSIDGGRIEVISASWKLLSEVKCLLLAHFGITGILKKKTVAAYAENDYWRLSLNGLEAERYVEMVGFRSLIRQSDCRGILGTERNPNVDSIPHIGGLLSAVHESSETTQEHVTLVRDYKGKDPLAHVTYDRLAKILRATWLPSSALDRLAEINAAHYFYDEVLRVEALEPVPTFDFSMPKTHSFLLHGLVTHNSHVQ
jgi:recombination protein RecA